MSSAAAEVPPAVALPDEKLAVSVSTHVDDRAMTLATMAHNAPVTDEEKRRVLRKIDWLLIPLASGCVLCT